MKKAITRAHATAAAFIILLSWVLLNGVTVLQNAEQLPDAFIKTRDSILSLYYKNSSWTGIWSSNPEGYMDSDSGSLSNVDVYLKIHTEQGKVEGTVATRKLCTRLPFAMDGVLFRGEVSGKSVHGVAYDYIGGKEIQLALVTIKRAPNDASILIVNFTSDTLESFPSRARIRNDFNAKPFDAKTNSSLYCEPLRYPHAHSSTQEKRKPISELWHTFPVQ